VTVKVAEFGEWGRQTSLSDFITDGDEPSQHPTLEGEAQFFNHIPVRPNVDAEGGVNAENRPERVGNQGYARTGIPNSCSRCGQVNRQCRHRVITHLTASEWGCAVCAPMGEYGDALLTQRRLTGYFEHPLWAWQYERLQRGA